ncbi:MULTISPECIES: sarcosine oxidase subunit delta [Paracoccaceae]|jgi:heterotetrameric sarcosine oxidase delta subunit|uniref:sarcosine oxidase subunit delta n=1 Tax=Paracoccaceae TaxID=31989 RepID=UPI003059AC97
MLLLPCPYCGPRDEGEFHYGGPLRALPPMDGTADAAAWQAVLGAGAPSGHPGGPLREIWYHASGCERWITLSRGLVSHDIPDAARAAERGGQP